VDDGSTDESRAIIAGYGDRVRPLLKENGGQGSALNAGFAICRGDIIFFLDADDRLRPDIARLIANALDNNPAAVRAHFRLAVIDAAGQPTGQLLPPARRPLPGGDLRQAVLSYGDDIPWLPTSGNAFRRAALAQIMPLPAGDYPICADYYLLNLSALVGPVLALDVVGGEYRAHGANADYAAGLALERSRRTIRLSRQTHEHIRQRAASLAPRPARVAPGGVSYIAHRLLSLRLEPAAHPIPGERRLPLLAEGIRVALRRTDRPWPLRLAYGVWLLAVALAPKRLLPWLARGMTG
jgi:glycosyltransferase involved in cell wall biosynthesis